MKSHRLAVLAVAFALVGGGMGMAAKPPATWDDLVLVKSKKLDRVYLQPGADFRGYTKVIIDPTEVALQKNWQRNYNSQTMGLSGRISDSDVRKVLDAAAPAATKVFAEEFAAAGYPVVTEPGPDVLRVRTAVINISVNAPDRQTAGRSRSFSGEAGEGTLVLEARDSITGAILGRALDRRLAGDNSMLLRNSVTNRADFRTLARNWARAAVRGLAVLKENSPISAN